jgi:hypothetical protein
MKTILVMLHMSTAAAQARGAGAAVECVNAAVTTMSGADGATGTRA